MATTVSTLGVLITVKEELTKTFTDISKKTKDIGKNMKDLGKGLSKNVTLPLTILGGVAITAFNAIDEANANLVKGTGATGEALEEMTSIVKNIAREVPQSLGDVGQAVADVNTRFKVSGDELQGLSNQFLDFARVSDVDVTTAISSVSRVMGDWGVETENTGDILDGLLAVSQATGATVDQLAQVTTNYGVQMRSLGFTMNESIALFGKFEAEGVSTEKMVGGLSIALGKLAAEGFPSAEEGFNELLSRITEAPTEIDAMNEAISLLGTRAGPDFALAVLEGRFAMDDYLSIMENAEGTLASTAEASLTFKDNLAILRNEMTVALAPVGKVMVKIFREQLQPILKRVGEVVGDLAEKFGNADPKLQKFVVIAGLLLAALGPVLIALGVAVTVIGALISPIGLVVAAIVGLIAAFFLLKDKIIAILTSVKDFFSLIWDGIKIILDIWLKTWKTQLDLIFLIWETIIIAIQNQLTAFMEFWGEIWDDIMVIATEVFRLLKVAWDLMWEGFMLVFGDSIAAIQDGLGVLFEVWSNVWEGLKAVLGPVIDFIVVKIGNVMQKIQVDLLNALSVLKSGWDSLWNGILNTVNSIVDKITATLEVLISGIRNAINVVRNFGGLGSIASNIRVSNLTAQAAAGGGDIRTGVLPGGGGLNRTQQVVVTGNTFLDERAAEKMGDLVFGKLRLQKRID